MTLAACLMIIVCMLCTSRQGSGTTLRAFCRASSPVTRSVVPRSSTSTMYDLSISRARPALRWPTSIAKRGIALAAYASLGFLGIEYAHGILRQAVFDVNAIGNWHRDGADERVDHASTYMQEVALDMDAIGSSFHYIVGESIDCVADKDVCCAPSHLPEVVFEADVIVDRFCDAISDYLRDDNVEHVGLAQGYASIAERVDFAQGRAWKF